MIMLLKIMLFLIRLGFLGSVKNSTSFIFQEN